MTRLEVSDRKSIRNLMRSRNRARRVRRVVISSPGGDSGRSRVRLELKPSPPGVNGDYSRARRASSTISS